MSKATLRDIELSSTMEHWAALTSLVKLMKPHFAVSWYRRDAADVAGLRRIPS